MRSFSTFDAKDSLFSQYFQELQQAKEQDFDAYIDKFQQFSNVLYENLDKIDQIDVSQSLSHLTDLLSNQGKNQQSLYNPYILVLNDVFDAFPLQDMNQVLQVQFYKSLNTLEKLVRSNVNQIGLETLTNSVYYFCKFQAGQPDLWQVLESQVLKQKDNFTIEQLSKILLALVMNNRQIPDNMWSEILKSILNKMDKADAKDTFYISMALGRGKIRPELIVSDVYYTLYLNISRNIAELDLFQLSQLSMFLTTPYASPYVPDEFWNNSLEKALIEAMDNFKKYEGKINKKVYLDDFVRTLVSFGLRELGSKSFIQKIEEFFQNNLQHLDGKMTENLVFFLYRVDSKNDNFLRTILGFIQQEKFIEKGEFRDHIMLLNIAKQYQIQAPLLYQQIEKVLLEQMIHNKESKMNPIQQLEIMSIYAYEFSKAKQGTQDDFWMEFKRFLADSKNLDGITFTSLAHSIYAVVQQLIQDDIIWDCWKINKGNLRIYSEGLNQKLE